MTRNERKAQALDALALFLDQNDLFLSVENNEMWLESYDWEIRLPKFGKTDDLVSFLRKVSSRIKQALDEDK